APDELIEVQVPQPALRQLRPPSPVIPASSVPASSVPGGIGGSAGPGGLVLRGSLPGARILAARYRQAEPHRLGGRRVRHPPLRGEGGGEQEATASFGVGIARGGRRGGQGAGRVPV